MQLYCLRYWKHYYFVTHWGNEMIDFMIRQIIININLFNKTGIKRALEEYDIFIPDFVRDDEYYEDEYFYDWTSPEEDEVIKLLTEGLDFSTKIQICFDLLKDGIIITRNDPGWGKRVKKLLNEIVRETKFVRETIIDDTNEHKSNAYNVSRRENNVAKEYKEFVYALYYVTKKERILRIFEFEQVLQKLLLEMIKLKTADPSFTIINDFTSYSNNNNNNNNNNDDDNLNERIRKARNEALCTIGGEKYHYTDGWQKTKLQTALINHLIDYPNEKHLSQFILFHLFDDLQPHLYRRRGREKKNTFDKWYDMCYANLPKCLNALVPLTLELDKEFNGDRVDRGMKIKVNVNIERKEGKKKAAGADNTILDIKSPKGTEPKVYIISGDAGTGKTILLSSMFTQSYLKPRKVYIANDKNIGLSPMEIFYHHSFNFVFYLNFKSPTCETFEIHSPYNFDEYLEAALPRTLESFNLQQIKKTLSKYKCLILCDNFDYNNGISSSSDDMRIFESLISFQPENWKVVITTQPGNTKLLTNIAKKKWDENNVINLRILDIDRNDAAVLIKEAIYHHITDNDDDDDALLDIERKIEDISNHIIDNVLNIKTEEEDDGEGRSLRIKDTITKPLYFNYFVSQYVRENYNASGDRITNALDDKKITDDLYFMKHYLTQEQYKFKHICENKCGISLQNLKAFDKLYSKYSLANYTNGRKLELTENEVMSWIWANSTYEIRENFDVISSYYFDIKNNRTISSKDGELSTITKTTTTTPPPIIHQTFYCYKYAKELEFAAARKICADIEKLRIEWKKGNKRMKNVVIRNERYEEAKTLVDIFNRVLVSNGIAEIPSNDYNDVDDRHHLYHYHQFRDMKILFPKLKETIIAMHGIIIPNDDIHTADNTTLNLKNALMIITTTTLQSEKYNSGGGGSSGSSGISGSGIGGGDYDYYYYYNNNDDNFPLLLPPPPSPPHLSNRPNRKRLMNDDDDEDDDDDDYIRVWGEEKYRKKRKETRDNMIQSDEYPYDNNYYNNDDNDDNKRETTSKFVFGVQPRRENILKVAPTTTTTTTTTATTSNFVFGIQPFHKQ